MTTRKRPALGRGLGALIPATKPPATPTASPQLDTSPTAGGVRSVPIEQLRPHPDQPRKRFEPTALEQLAESLRNQGMIQPIVAMRLAPKGEQNGVRYQIIAGERRWRAAQKAGLLDVPVVLRERMEDRERMELALVENIQRADLNPIEEAQAYRVLMELGAYTQDQLAQRVGKDRSTVSNAMRLLRLPEPVQDMVRDGRLSMGHARALLGLEHEEDIRSVAQEAFRSGWNVRATEQAVRQRTARAREQTRPSHPDDERHKIIVGELETRLRRKLGVRARLRTKGSGNKAGVLEIPYASLEELDRLLHIIMAEGV